MSEYVIFFDFIYKNMYPKNFFNDHVYMNVCNKRRNKTHINVIICEYYNIYIEVKM